jgi:glycosyltransferase involved in cell wall biosynthesis
MTKISTVIPVYDVEVYLEETIQSVIAQDIGFKKNCEIIFIDDESPDSSYKICKKYSQLYPDNIKYIKQKNAGVSAARNRGLKLAKGKFVHFLDSDDVMSRNAYSEQVALYEQTGEQTDVVAARVEFFGATLGDHPLNDKFGKGKRIVSLVDEPEATILHVSSCLIRKSAIKHEFESHIKISEDMKFLTQLVCQKMTLGVVPKATYYYRKRHGGGSAIDTARENPTFYTVTPKEVYVHLLEELSLIDGSPNIYVQHAVAYDLKWRLRQTSQRVISSDQEEEYVHTIKAISQKIDPEVLLGQKEFTVQDLLYLLGLKYGESIPGDLLETLAKRARSSTPTVFLEFVTDLGNGILRFEGRVPNGSDLHDIYAVYGKRKLELTYTDFSYRRRKFLNETVGKGYVFTVDIKLSKIAIGDVSFSNHGRRLPIVPRRQSKLPHARFSYGVYGNNLLLNMGTFIVVRPYSKLLHSMYEIRWLFRITGSLRSREAAKAAYMIVRSTKKRSISLRSYANVFIKPLRRLIGNLVIVLLRLAYRAYKPRMPIWLISDRPFSAGDNGEALYRYIENIKDRHVQAFFVISRKSPEYPKMKLLYSDVIAYESWRYKLMFLRSSKIISSQADEGVINPFKGRVEELYDLFSFDFVFLQHGILRNDLSEWLNRYNKNIRLFITSAESERDAILRYDYAYDKKNVLLSGLPRFDLLNSAPEKKIIIAPTWRRELTEEAIDSSGLRPYNAAFKESEYFKFFNNLVNHRKLINTMKKYGYTADFYLHPLLSAQSGDFDKSDTFVMKRLPYDYKKAFEQGSMLITDYSSVFFDFAYLEKPVIYAQFDKDTYYDGQMYTPGYMNDEKDGFGPVASDLEGAVREIIRMIQSGCMLEDKYKKRIETFYAYRDKNNSKRVYEAILELEQGL